MNQTKEQILEILDQCASQFTFPALDNGYVYLAATKMSVYISKIDWAIVIEVFGFSPRSGDPDIHIYIFSNNLHNRKAPSDFVSEDAYKRYLHNNPYNESKFIFPIKNDTWQDKNNIEYVKQAGQCLLRELIISLPPIGEYKKHGIALKEGRPTTFDFCRFLASKYRDNVLSTEKERRICVAPEMRLLLQIDKWNHPDITNQDLPSRSETFVQIAEAIVTGDKKAYQTTKKSNTHWRNWSEGGTL